MGIPEMAGGVLAVWLLSALTEWAFFKRVHDDPLTGKLSSAVAGYLLASVIATFGMADGRPLNWGPTFIIYFPGLLIVGAFAYRRGKKLRSQAGGDEVAQTFE